MSQLRRTALYIPGSNPKALGKAKSLAADVVVLDLEDSVAPEMKDEARKNITTAVAGGFGSKEIVLRVNDLQTPWGLDDLSLAADLPVSAILVPKVASGSDLLAYEAHLGNEHRLWAMIETARSMFRLEEIASASPRLSAFVMGTNDLAKEMQASPGPRRENFIGFLAQTVAAARAYGLAVLDGVCNEFTDLELFSAECEQGRALGFDGKTVIHPNQIEICNGIFSPSEGEIVWAEEVVAAFALPEHAGKGAIRVKGQMVERLHMAQAEVLLERANAIGLR